MGPAEVMGSRLSAFARVERLNASDARMPTAIEPVTSGETQMRQFRSVVDVSRSSDGTSAAVAR